MDEVGDEGVVGKIKLSNAEFLSALRAPGGRIGVIPDDAVQWVCHFPKYDKKWNGHPYAEGSSIEYQNENTFFCISMVRPVDDKLYRRNANFAAMLCVVLDDIGTKAKAPDLKPSWKTETSSGNEQWGYIFDNPITDPALAERLMKAIIAAGYCDKGAGSPETRYMRLPVGSNGKPEHTAANDDKPVPHIVIEWQPERLFSLEQLVDALGLRLNGADSQIPAQPLTGESRFDALPKRQKDSELIRQITTAENYHDPVLTLSARYRARGMDKNAIIETLRGLMEANGDNSERWRDRYEDIPRIVVGAFQKFQLQAPGISCVDFRLVPVADLLKEPKPHNWLIHNYLERDSVNLLFGDPAVGKSLLVVDWASCIATGREWGGCTTKQGSVIYLAGEGHNGLARRLKAWEVTTGLTLSEAPIFVSSGAISLIDDSGIPKIIEAAESAITQHGKPALMVVDTLARHFIGGDENAAPDMTLFINALDALRQKYGCAVLIVHHSGHSNKDRARAHSALPAAVDAIFCLTKDRNGIRSLRCDKSKDFEPPQERAFIVRGVDLPWLDDDQLTRLSAPVLEATAALPAKAAKSLSDSAQTALRALHEAVERAGINAPPDCIAAAGSEAFQRGKVVTLKDWKARYFQTCEDSNKDSARKAFRRARDALVQEERIKIFDLWVWLPGGIENLSIASE